MAAELESVASGNRAAELLLDVQGVRYAYGDLVAVWDVSFQARAGAVTAIVGRNGAGKTTLMFGLSGELPATAGKVRLSGVDITNAPTWVRANQGLCLVPEGKRVFADLTVEENITVGLPRTVRRHNRAERCAEQFERFPILREKRSRLAGSLSGGQQQLLAIASALAMHPKVLCIDEPSSGLAPTAVDTVLRTLDDLKHEGLAVVLVEQMVEEVVSGIADELIVIEQGRVVMQDVPGRISLGDLERLMGVA
jgi:branched-chain amino acid transport system ATP-binding protein